MADLSLRAIESSNLPATQKSSLRRLFDGAMSRSPGSYARAKLHVVSGAQAMRKGGEGVVMGCTLGAASVYFKRGLDMHVGQMSIPVDAAIGVVGLVGSTVFAAEGYAEDMANAGQSALTVFAFRKSAEYFAKQAAAPKAKGDFGFDGYSSDRIIQAAANM